MLKRLISVSLALVMFFACALPAFAGTSLGAAVMPPYSEDDGNFIMGTFITSTLSEDQKSFMREVLSSNRGFICSEFSASFKVISFHLVDEGVTPVNIVSTHTYLGSSGMETGVFVTFSKTNSVRSLSFSYQDNGTFTALSSDIKKSPFDWAYIGYLLGANYFTSNNFTFPNVGFGYLWPNNLKPLILQDDGGLMSDPNPDPPPVDPIPPYNPDYVPYDPSIWLGFVSYIKSALGSSVNIGLQIFAILTGILVAIRIVKIFAKHK